MAGIDRKVSVLNTTAEGRKVVLTEVLTAEKNEGEKTKLVSAENKLQINHPTIKSFCDGRGSREAPPSASRTGRVRMHRGLASSLASPAQQGVAWPTAPPCTSVTCTPAGKYCALPLFGLWLQREHPPRGEWEGGTGGACRQPRLRLRSQPLGGRGTHRPPRQTRSPQGAAPGTGLPSSYLFCSEIWVKFAFYSMIEKYILLKIKKVIFFPLNNTYTLQRQTHS